MTAFCVSGVEPSGFTAIHSHSQDNIISLFDAPVDYFSVINSPLLYENSTVLVSHLRHLLNIQYRPNTYINMSYVTNCKKSFCQTQRRTNK